MEDVGVGGERKCGGGGGVGGRRVAVEGVEPRPDEEAEGEAAIRGGGGSGED